MAAKRKVEVIVPAEESDQLLIRPLWVRLRVVILMRAYTDCYYMPP